MSAMASQITSLTTVYSSVCSGADPWKHKSSASLAFVRGIHFAIRNVNVYWGFYKNTWRTLNPTSHTCGIFLIESLAGTLVIENWYFHVRWNLTRWYYIRDCILYYLLSQSYACSINGTSHINMTEWFKQSSDYWKGDYASKIHFMVLRVLNAGAYAVLLTHTAFVL